MSVAGVLNEPCTVWFAAVGVRVGMNFLGVLHSVRMVWLRLGEVSGWCVEWAVPIVICCWRCESWIEFPFVLHSAGLVLLRFGDVSGYAEWAVPIVICCWRCEFWRWREIRFFCVPAVVAWVLGRWREIRPPPSILRFPLILLTDDELYIHEFKTLTDGFGENYTLDIQTPPEVRYFTTPKCLKNTFSGGIRMSRNEYRSLKLEDVGESWDVETVSDFCLLMNFYSQRRFLHHQLRHLHTLGWTI